MPQWLTELSAFTAFLGIAGVGFVFLLISLIFGEIFEAFGDFDHDFDGGLGHGGPGFLSTRVLSVFVTAFVLRRDRDALRPVAPAVLRHRGS